jgi:hypothetical protein
MFSVATEQQRCPHPSVHLPACLTVQLRSEKCLRVRYRTIHYCYWNFLKRKLLHRFKELASEGLGDAHGRLTGLRWIWDAVLRFDSLPGTASLNVSTRTNQTHWLAVPIKRAVRKSSREEKRGNPWNPRTTSLLTWNWVFRFHKYQIGRLFRI